MTIIEDQQMTIVEDQQMTIVEDQQEILSTNQEPLKTLNPSTILEEPNANPEKPTLNNIPSAAEPNSVQNVKEEEEEEEETVLEAAVVASLSTQPPPEQLFFIDIKPDDSLALSLETPSTENVGEIAALPDSTCDVQEPKENTETDDKTDVKTDDKTEAKVDPANDKSFPSGSRLQILNLPLDYPTSESSELKDLFSPHGEIFAISFQEMPKSIHAFIQFSTPEIMMSAIKALDRHEMPQGFKLDLTDADKRALEKLQATSKAVDLKPSRTAVAEQSQNSRKRRDVRDTSRPTKKSNTSRQDSFDQSYRDDTRSTPSSQQQHSTLPSNSSSANVQILALGKVNDAFVEFVEKRCTQAGLTWHTKFITYRERRVRIISDCQSKGFVGVVLVEPREERLRNVCLHLLPTNGPQRNYPSLSVSEACAFMNTELKSRVPMPQMNAPAMMSNPYQFAYPPPQQQLPPQQQFPPQQVFQNMQAQQLLGTLLQQAQFQQQPIYHHPVFNPPHQQQQQQQQAIQPQLASLLSQLTSNQQLLNSLKKP